MTVLIILILFDAFSVAIGGLIIFQQLIHVFRNTLDYFSPLFFTHAIQGSGSYALGEEVLGVRCEGAIHRIILTDNYEAIWYDKGK